MNAPTITFKGRAMVARPLLCLAGLTILLTFGIAGTAQAIPVPTLTSTNPASPGATTTPRIKGVVEEGETKVITFGVATSGLRPITQAEEPNNTVRLYTTVNCAPGSEIGTGTVALLEGEGILVDRPVATDAVTTFYATQTNEAEVTSVCSQGLAYRQVTTLPSAPVFTGVNPPPPANSNFPRLIGTAPAESTVLLYANPSCSGSAVGSGSAALFGSEGIQVIVLDNTETTFSAKATFGEFASACSSSLAYREETPPPNPGPGPGPGPGEGGGGGPVGGATPVDPPPAPRLRTVPGGSANNNSPLVTGSAPGAGRVWVYASQDCAGSPVAKSSAAEFAAGIPVRVIDNTVVVFTAVALAGDKASKCSEPVTYVEDSVTPRTRITMAPASKTAKRKAVIRFTDSSGALPGTVFLCKVDTKKWKQCSSPLRLKKLKPKRYTVRVKASDRAGNVEIKGAKRSFKVIGR